MLQWIEYMYDTDARVAIESGCEWRKGWGIQGIRYFQVTEAIEKLIVLSVLWQGSLSVQAIQSAAPWLLTNLYRSQLQWGGYNSDM